MSERDDGGNVSTHFEHVNASRDEGVDDVDRAIHNCPLQQAAIRRLAADIHIAANQCKCSDCTCNDVTAVSLFVLRSWLTNSAASANYASRTGSSYAQQGSIAAT
jgi:hypothetical protein